MTTSKFRLRLYNSATLIRRTGASGRHLILVRRRVTNLRIVLMVGKESMCHSENCSLNCDHTEMTEVEPTWCSRAEGIDKDGIFSNRAENIYFQSLRKFGVKRYIYQMKCSKSGRNCATTFVSACSKSLIIIRTIRFVLFGTGTGVRSRCRHVLEFGYCASSQRR